MDPSFLLTRFAEVATDIAAALAANGDVSDADGHEGQYSFDVLADEIAVPALVDLGVGVLSEESGLHFGEREIVVAVDPVDGSTNYSRGLPWYAASLCAVDADGPLASLVMNLATGTSYAALRGEGATKDGTVLKSRDHVDLEAAILVMNGLPDHHYGWRQARVMGATALDLCEVAAGGFDGLVDATPGELAPWDYLGGLLVCTEVDVVVEDVFGRPLDALDYDARRGLIAGCSERLFEEIREARN